LAGVGLTALVACSSDKPDNVQDEQRTGTLSLPLRTVSNTGKIYVLRNAVFEILNFDTGESRFLTTKEGVEAETLLTTQLTANTQYAVTLLDGWTLVRLDAGGGGGGTGGTPGSAGAPPFPIGGAFDEEPPSEGGKASASDAASAGGEGPDDPSTAGKGGASSSGGKGGTTSGGSGPVGGTGTGGGGPIGGEVVIPREQVRLVTEQTPQTQFVFMTPQADVFVNYHFRVGEDVIEFNKGNLHISFTVDDVPACIPPEGVTRPERVLLDASLGATDAVSLRDVFGALTTNGGFAGEPELLFDQIYDSFAQAPGQVSSAKHCGDETTDGRPSLNGFPLDCDRFEAQQVGQMDGFRATAFVNRIDLAPTNGAHCGQQRIIFSSQNLPRSLMIVEAQVPNPHPELGIQGCRALAEFWVAQDQIADPVERGQRLRQAFLFGDVPGLEDFPPFFRAENLTVGSGQIRVNTFNSDPWTLREFKLAVDGESLQAIPFPVAESPNGFLWNEATDLAQGPACRESFLSAMDGLLTNDMSAMGFVVDGPCRNSESRNDFFTEDYRIHLRSSPGFRSQIEEKLASVGSPLSADDIANRARFAGSCIGCHMEGRGQSLGDGVFSPPSEDFPMVVEFPSACRDDRTQACFSPSGALTNVFLPGRMRTMAATFGIVVPNPCDGTGGGGGVGGGTGTGGSTTGGVAGTFGMGNSPGSGGSIAVGGSGMIPPDSEPAPVIDIALPSAEEPVEILRDEDAEIRLEYGDVTISGKPASSTH
jgi:hypothetical protein